jgi:hypothetical protein
MTYGEMGAEGKQLTSPMLRAWESFLTTEFPTGATATWKRA